MSHHDQTEETDSACCCEPLFYQAPSSPLMKDPWECYEGDTDACAPEAAETADDCGCCCC